MPRLRHGTIDSVPYLATQMRGRLGIESGTYEMGTIENHRKYAEQCVAMARLSEDDSDKALWLTLAQSWVRLAEHVARGEQHEEPAGEGDEALCAVQSSGSA